MRQVLWTIIVAICTCGVAAPPCGAQAAPAETPAERDARMDWWREARFGLFIHWGLYAIPAGEWNGQTHYGEWIRHSAQIPIDTYDRFVQQFNPVKFNADEWVRLAKEAGMKYIVITSKHHDGFCLFDSKHTDFDVMSAPFQRDVLKELSEACAREGIRLCFYHSIMDWHHPDYLPRREWEAATRPTDGADFDRYVRYMKAQVEELLTGYGPIGVMWFDGEWEGTWTHDRGQDLFQHVRRLSPATIVNNRVDKGRAGMAGLTREGGFLGDFGTPEQEVPSTGLPGVDWESCITMNGNWGYNRADLNYKNSTDLIRMLVDIASKGGNLLLNVGPTAEGEFPPQAVERLREIGRWMAVNGESIYGTQAGPFKELPWGRCTMRANEAPAGPTTDLYLHVFSWPADGKLTLPGIANEAEAAYLLADPQRAGLRVKRVEDALVVQLPEHPRDASDTVVCLRVRGTPDIYNPPEFSADHPIFVESLDIFMSTQRERADIRYTLDGSEPTAESPVAEGPVRLTDTTTVKARLFRDGRAASATSEARFAKVTPRQPDLVSLHQAASHWVYSYHEGEWDHLPNLEELKAVKRGSTQALVLSPRLRADRFAFRFAGWIDAPRDGVYTFYLTSDDGSRLLIDRDLIVDNDGLHGAIERTGTVALAKGIHPLRVEYFERTGDELLAVEWSGPGMPRQPVQPASGVAGSNPDAGDVCKSYDNQSLPEPAARPTLPQLAWHDAEIGMFIHFAPNTYLDLEYDDLTLPLDKFNPDRLDTDQWVSAAETMGANYIIFVAKHAGGFCLWQTATTDYSIKSTPWRDGKGDILKDLVASCRKRGMKVGVYVSPADRKHGAGLGGRVDTAGPAATYTAEATRAGNEAAMTPLSQEAYNDLYRRQLVEVFDTMRSGLPSDEADRAVFEVWFDGSIQVPVGDILAQYAPNAIVFQGPHASIRWVGNEDGIAPYPAWNALAEADARTGEATATNGNPNGTAWMPLECDARMRNTWFWNTGNADSLKSVEALMDMYYRSVGHGAVLLLNHTPDPTGLIPEADVHRGAAFHAEVRRRFGNPVASAEHIFKGDPEDTPDLATDLGVMPEISFRRPTTIDHVIVMEDISHGERVREYTIEGRVGDTWQPLAMGTAIGHKKIDRFPPVEVSAVRVCVGQSAGTPIFRSFAAYHVGG